MNDEDVLTHSGLALVFAELAEGLILFTHSTCVRSLDLRKT